MQARIVDIANKVGVSRSTVDRALHGRGRIDEQLRQKILLTAKEMNYRPNTLARSLKTNRTGIIGVLMPAVMTSFFADIIQGISEASNEAGDALLFCLTRDQESVEKYISVLIEKRVDGVILAPFPEVFDPKSLCQQFLDVEIPVLSITRPAGHPDVPQIISDNVKGGYLAAKHLLALGHRKIAYLSYAKNDVLAMDRYKGFIQAVNEFKIEDSSHYFIDVNAPDHVKIDQLLSLPTRPTAIFASTDFLAANIIEQFQGQGIKVPGDVSVVGFDDLMFCTMTSPKITTIRQPKLELGLAAFEHLKRMISRQPVQDLIMDVELVVRNSTSPVN